MVRKLTGAEKRDQVSLASLKASQQQIEARIDKRRDGLKQNYARDWEKMERRHAAERTRDERLIDRNRSEGSRGRAGEVARKSFRVKAGSDTASPSPTLSERKRMAAALDKAARKVSSDDGGKGKVSEERLERAKRRRNRPRTNGKGFERD